MQSSHAVTAVDVAFDEPNLIADAGLVPVMALAEQVGLPGLVARHVAITGAGNSAGANPAAKVMSLLAGMVAGADSITDVDRLRLGGMDVAFGGVRAPSTLGTFLRAFTHGHVQQLNAVLRQTLILAYYQGLKYHEIAEVLGIPLGTVKSRLHGAIARLRAMAQATHPVGRS